MVAGAGRRCPRENGARDDTGAHWLPDDLVFTVTVSFLGTLDPDPRSSQLVSPCAMTTTWRPALLSGDPVVVKEEPDDDHHHNPAVNVEPPADDHGEDEKSEDLAGKMSTIWRPNLGRLRASVAEMEGSESKEEEKNATKKGVKRKRAPPTKGPCEHRVKPRSKCKVCSACPHGKWR